MAVTVSPTSVLARIKDYQAGTGKGIPLTHVGLVSTAPGSIATPSALAGGFFDVWYDPTNNNLILDYASTQT